MEETKAKVEATQMKMISKSITKVVKGRGTHGSSGRGGSC